MRAWRASLRSAVAAAFVTGCLVAQDVSAELEKPVNPRSDLPCPSPDLYSPLRPDPPGTPTLVGIAVWFQDISHLSDVDQTLSTDVYVMLRWQDKRLVDPARGEGAADCPPPDGGLWIPAIELENLRSRQQFYNARFMVNSRGVITNLRRSLVQTANALNFRDFPFDRHRWKFSLWPVFSRADEIVFRPLVIGRNENLSIQGWRVEQPEATATIAERPPRVGAYARFDVYLGLVRDWQYYMWKLGLPLTLIVLMAYGVYYIPSSAVAQQIALGMTSMLTLIAYMLALSSSLPKISYLTKADKFFVGSAVLVFLGLVKAILSAVLGQRGNTRPAERADRLGRLVYPLGMILSFAIAFLL